MSKKSVRRSLSMTPEMALRLQQITTTKPRNITESDLMRQAIRQFLDEQEHLVGSRRHFQKSLRERVDTLESALSFQLIVLTYLLTIEDSLIHEAIIMAKQRGSLLLEQMQAVRELDEDSE